MGIPVDARSVNALLLSLTQKHTQKHTQQFLRWHGRHGTFISKTLIMEISSLNNKLSTLFHLRPCQDHFKQILRSTWVRWRIWIMMMLKETHWGWWKRNGKRRRREVMEAEKRMGLVEREKVQRLDFVTTDPWLHCCTNKQAVCRLPWVQLWRRRGKLSFQRAEVEPGKRWGWGLDVYPRHFLTSPSASQWTEEQGNISFEKLVDCMPFPALIGCLGSQPACGLITVNLSK